VPVTATLDWAEFAAKAFEPRDVFGLLGYVPTPKQVEFHNATEFDVLYGGAAGGGKTKALLMDAIRDCDIYPGLRVGAFRRSYPELKESLIAELAQVGFAKKLGATWNGTEYELRFANGSLIMFRYAKSIEDATRRQGGQYQKLLFDERTLTPPDVVSFLESRLRSGRRDIPVLGIRSGTNPGGAGHGAVKTRYIKPTNYGAKVITDVRGRTVRFIPSKLSDNPHVNPEYAQDLQALDGKLRSAFLDGDWDVFQGQMFPELKRDRHVIEPITLPASWKRYNGLDWGFTAPWAVLWAAVDEDGRVWIYREIYQRGRSARPTRRSRSSPPKPRRARRRPVRRRRHVGHPR
jgi:phage terminase large subunit